MALASGDVLVYDGTQWNNQPSTSDLVNLVGPVRLHYSSVGSNYTSFTLGSDGTLTVSTAQEAADLILNPRGNLELGTDLVDLVRIGRTNASIQTTIRGTFLVTTSGGTNGLSQDSSARLYWRVPNSAPTDGNIAASQVSAWIDETNNQLKFRVKYSDDMNYKTGSVALS